MDCPKCAKGQLRVVAIVACACGNSPLVCDGCFQQFRVACGGPQLPPEATLREDGSHRQAYEDAKASGMFPDMTDSYEEMSRDTITSQPEFFPTVEEYRAMTDPPDGEN